MPTNYERAFAKRPEVYAAWQQLHGWPQLTVAGRSWPIQGAQVAVVDGDGGDRVASPQGAKPSRAAGTA